MKISRDLAYPYHLPYQFMDLLSYFLLESLTLIILKQNRNLVNIQVIPKKLIVYLYNW